MSTPTEPSYRTIPLTQGQVALVDEDDYERLARHKWRAQWNPGTRSFYAIRHSPRNHYKRRTIFMHREVLGMDADDPRHGEHREPERTLDNRKSNLRAATCAQNQWNARTRRDNTSGFKGVNEVRPGRWKANFSINGKRMWLGPFGSKEEAAAKRAESIAQNHGEFSRM